LNSSFSSTLSPALANGPFFYRQKGFAIISVEHENKSGFGDLRDHVRRIME
jgi:hypothetical protein